METRAPFVIVGAFVLAAIVAVFGFVYWLQNTGGLGPRATYHVQFEGSVPGLLVGAAVLFNGIRVGEVTDLGLAPDNPRRVNATISVASTTPVRADTKVGLEFQGLTGVPVIALEGGMQLAKSGEVPTLIAEPGRRAGHDAGRARRVARVDSVLSENSGAAEGHHRQFQGVLGRPGAQHRQARRHRRRPRTHDRRRHAGAERSPTICARCKIRDRRARPSRCNGDSGADGGCDAGDAAHSCSRRRRNIPAFAEAMWADALPKLLQARLIESFENYDIAHAPLRMTDIGQTDFQLADRCQAVPDRDRIPSRRPKSDCRRGSSTRTARSSPRGCSRNARNLTRSSRRRPSPRSAMRSAELPKDMIAWTVQALQ